MVLIIGSNGQLGREMQRKLTKVGKDFIASDYPNVDIGDANSLRALISDVKPDTVVNCAGYTNVDQAESEESVAYRVNALGPQYLAQLCAQRDIELVHVSTDYVFSGKPILEGGIPRPYVESDPCVPSTAYGRTKLAGDRFVEDLCPKHYIFRTSWLYGDGNNFVRTMLKLARSLETVRVVCDQIGSPTSADNLGDVILSLLGSGAYGLYHATGEGQCSWYEFARAIFAMSGINIAVEPITSDLYPRPAKRPQWSVLENRNLRNIGMNVFLPWMDALRAYLSENAR